MTVHVRLATDADRELARGLVPRLHVFGPPPLRPIDAMNHAEEAALLRALDTPDPDHVVFVAEVEGLGPVGIAFAETQSDYFTRERHGHLSIIAVSEAGEGRGAGSALLAEVESWTAARGHRFLTLNVFEGNMRARRVYERAGFEPETIRYVKRLR